MDDFQKHKNFEWVIIRMLNWMKKRTGKRRENRWEKVEKIHGKIKGKIDGELDRKIDEYTR